MIREPKDIQKEMRDLEKQFATLKTELEEAERSKPWPRIIKIHIHDHSVWESDVVRTFVEQARKSIPTFEGHEIVNIAYEVELTIEVHSDESCDIIAVDGRKVI